MKELKAVVHAYCEEHKINKIPDEFRENDEGELEMGLLGADKKMYWFPKTKLPIVLENIVDRFVNNRRSDEKDMY